MEKEYAKIKSWLLTNGYNNYDVLKVTIDNIAHTIESYLQHKAKIIGEANDQASVSGNEANPKENKKDGEVALPFADAEKFIVWVRERYNQLNDLDKWYSVPITDKVQYYKLEELYGVWKAKGNDR